MNLPKKRKDKSSVKKRKINEEMKQHLDEISFDFNLYYAAFFDLNAVDNDFEDENFKEILFSLC